MRILLEEAIHLLQAGEVVGVPTETVYGLAASLSQPKAIAKIFALKQRPTNNPLIIHLADLSQLQPLLGDNVPDIEAFRSFWPGPLTLILPVQTAKVPEQARAGLSTAGFRIPANTLARTLIEKVGPLVMPSANLSGRPSSTSATHVENDFGPQFPVLDGGICDKGIESTILCRVGERWQIIRQGALTASDFKPFLGYKPEIAQGSVDKPLCPGQLYRHYAPKCRLHLKNNVLDQPGIILGFRGRNYTNASRIIELGDLSDPEGVAQQLYLHLRQLDAEGIEEAYVDNSFPAAGLWATIRERLQKASVF